MRLFLNIFFSVFAVNPEFPGECSIVFVFIAFSKKLYLNESKLAKQS